VEEIVSQSNEALDVWCSTNEQVDYIVAASGAVAAFEAFARVAACRDQLPQRYPDDRLGASGRELAVAHPGKVYRKRTAKPA
jgi:hypothetical protein